MKFKVVSEEFGNKGFPPSRAEPTISRNNRNKLTKFAVIRYQIVKKFFVIFIGSLRFARDNKNVLNFPKIIKPILKKRILYFIVASEAKRPYKNDQLFLKDRIPGHRKL